MGNCTLKAVAVLDGEAGAVCTEKLGYAKFSWKPVAASSETENHAPAAAFDANPNTYWSSTETTLPHSLTIDLGEEKALSGFAYTPQTHRRKGMMAKGTVSVSSDGKQWNKAVDFEFGNLVNDPTKRFCDFTKTQNARYVRIEVIGIEGGGNSVSIAEIDLF